MAAETNGRFSGIRRVNRVDTSVWDGRTEDRRGNKRTSSKARPSTITRSLPDIFPDFTALILDPKFGFIP
jgi:hypothetical protein